jgi:acyl-coenzyme A synthetase/AMP-(fatty) acid ligase
VTAVVVAAEGSTPDETALRSHAKGHLAGYKVPKEIVVIDELPKTSTGKT